jgi:hypothetical protein
VLEAKPAKRSGPVGKSLIMVGLASRPQGASAQELHDAIGWKLAGPWKADIRNICKRWGYGYDARTVEGDTRHFVTR